MPDLDDYYPSTRLSELYYQYCALTPEEKIALSSYSYDQLQDIDGLDGFLRKFANFLDRFGHLGDCGNDFSIPPWCETPDLVLKMVTDYQPTDNFQTPKINLSDLKARRQVSPIFLFFYHRVRDYQFLREKASSLYTRGKVIYRYYYQTLGKHYANLGLLDNPEDIFYLTPFQVEKLVDDEDNLTNYHSIIEKIKQDMFRLKDIHLPTIIYGDYPPPIKRDTTIKIMAGISTSIGVYTGCACVVKNMQDFPKLQQGDVLIIPYSDVSWAPLFARAGALVSEAGGMLSHGSIVAREYNIPAVVSVEMATSIPDGTLLTVDAHNGLVQIHE